MLIQPAHFLTRHYLDQKALNYLKTHKYYLQAWSYFLDLRDPKNKLIVFDQDQ